MKALVKRLKNIYVLSFGIPVLGMLGIIIARGIFPFGNNSFMFSDMYHQYIPFLTEFWRKLHNGESFAFSWYAGLGSNFVALYAYYLASPVNWLCYFCPEQYLMEFMTFFIVLKIGLCGFSFAYYLSKRFLTKDLCIVWFAVLYAMSGFIAAYNWNHMWMDVIYLAPFVILGLEKLVTTGRCRLYCLALTASVFTNYYLSILLCIFLVLYFMMQLFTNGLSLRQKGRAVWHFTIYSLLAGGMAGVLLFPVMNAMHVTDFHDINFPEKIEFYYNILEVLARHVVTLPTERGLEHWPNIYCGVLVFFLVPVYLLHKRIPLRQKIGRVLLLTVMLLAFSVNILDFIWHGLNYPDSLPARQSFLYIFVVLTMCFEAVYRNWENGRANRVCGILLGMLLLVACGVFVTTDGFTVKVVTCTWIFLTGYLLLFILFGNGLRRKKPKPQKLRKLSLYGKWIVLLLITVEAIINMEHTSVRPVQRGYYMNKKADYQALLEQVREGDDDFYRFESLHQMTKNDGTLAGYFSASVFSSTVNGSVENYYDSLGMGGSKVAYYYRGATPLTSALMGVHYTFSEEELQDSALYEFVAKHGSLYLYRNKLTLPVGFILPEELMGELEEEITEDLANTIITQNELVNSAGVRSSLFQKLQPAAVLHNGNEIKVCVEADGHLYGVVKKKPKGTVVFAQGEETKALAEVRTDILLDLGWFAEGDSFTLTAEEAESLEIGFYRLSVDTFKEAVQILGEQPFVPKGYTADSLTGTVEACKEGYLVLSIPYEPGWNITVDGVETPFEKFAETMIAVPLTKGSHTIEMHYSIHWAGAGLICSVVSLLLFCILEKAAVRARRAECGHDM